VSNTDRILPDNMKRTVDMLLRCGGAELQWLQIGMGLMLKDIIAEIMEKFLSKEPIDLVTWVSQIDREFHEYSREELAKILLRWYNVMEEFKR